MIGSGPSVSAQDEWVVIRNNPNVPAAIIRLTDRGLSTEHYRVVTFRHYANSSAGTGLSRPRMMLCATCPRAPATPAQRSP